MSASPTRRLLAVPNEDGAGPSALLSHLVRALLELYPGLSVTVWNQSRRSFNESLYADFIAEGRVEVEPVWNLVQVAKPGGRVSVPETLRLIGDYRLQRDEYFQRAKKVQADLILEFGVPAIARWAAARNVPAVSVFDHSWSRTFEMIAEVQPGLPPVTLAAWRELVQAIRDDEGFTSLLYLFPPFIAPAPFADYWQVLLSPERIRLLPGVLGGRRGWSRAAAQDYLRLTEPGPTILVQGGDSPVWDLHLPTLVRELLAADQAGNLDMNFVIYLPASVGSYAELAVELERPDIRRVRRLRFVPGHTIQAILPGIDFLFTRAGGGTVNDAIAVQTPFVCVREPGQAQVEAILEACVRSGLTRAVAWEEFAAAPLRTVLSEFSHVAQNGRLAGRLQAIENGVEVEVAREIGSRLGWS